MYKTELKPQHIFAQTAIKYGKIFSVKLAGTLIVVLNDYGSIKEAFQNPLLNDRPVQLIDKALNIESGKIRAQMRYSL